MKDPRLPDSISGLDVGEDGVLSIGGELSAFPWYTKEGYIGGTVRYRLIAEEVSMDDMFKTQEKTQC